jgi:hypothetical protein
MNSNEIIQVIADAENTEHLPVGIAVVFAPRRKAR